MLTAVAAILALTLLWPFASGLFAFGPLHADDLALTLGAGIVVLVVLELVEAGAAPEGCNPSAATPARQIAPLAMDQTRTPEGR